jgi:alpha-ketoglutarate-dependent taurine dioxygenase
MSEDPKKPSAGGKGAPTPLGGVRRAQVRLSEAELVRFAPLRSDGVLPILATRAVDGVDLIPWAERNREALRSRLVENGAILFRGFEIGGPERFEQLIAAVSGQLLEYKYGSTPRTRVGGNIYTSTEYPAHQEIPLHNEMSYSRDWPLKIWFFCVTPSPQGGETPIADSRRVFARIDPVLRDRMIGKGVLYVRNYGKGLDLPWQEVFQTEERAKVEEFCRAAGIDFEWGEGDRLRTREVCQAAEKHPVTHEAVWFNQAHLFHVSNVSAEARDQLLASYAEEDLPRNSYYGDGSPFDDADLERIRQAYRAEAVAFPWQAGDILMVDNMLTAHSRKPYSGPRRVVVGMAESWREARAGDRGAAERP